MLSFIVITAEISPITDVTLRYKAMMKILRVSLNYCHVPSILKHLQKIKRKKEGINNIGAGRYPTLNQYSALTIANSDYVS